MSGERHGLHGDASNDPWQVVELDDVSATLRWTALRDGAALLAVEHLVAGTELLSPAATVRLSGGHSFELSETT